MRLSYAGWNAKTAKRLFDLGYVTLPAHGKRLLIPNWQRFGDERTTFQDLTRIAEDTPPGCNISHVFGNASQLVGVDIDILDPKVSERIQIIAAKMLGDTPFIRVGKWPKVAMYYRKSGTGHKTTRTPGLEIFANSGQMVLFGIHPETRKPYVWPKCSPLNAEPHSMPAVTPGQIKGFLQAASELTSQHLSGLERDTNSTAHLTTLKEQRQNKMGCEYRDILLNQLSLMDPAKSNRHYIVVSVIGSMMHRGYSPKDIHALLEKPYIRRFESTDNTNRRRKIERIIRGFQRKQKTGRNRGRNNY